MKYMGILLLLVTTVLAKPFQLSTSFPDKKDILHFADLIAQYAPKKKQTLPHDIARSLEHLIFARNFIHNKLKVEEIHEKTFGQNNISIHKNNQSLSFDHPTFSLVLKRQANQLTSLYSPRESKAFRRYEKHTKPQQIKMDKAELSTDYSKTIITQLYQKISIARGLDPFLPENYELIQILDEDINLIKDQKTNKQIFFQVKEKIPVNEDSTTKWQYIPIRLVAKPLTKVMYEIPQSIVSIPVEAVARSPWHNLLGSIREFGHAAKSIPQNFKEIGQGLTHPKKGLVVEGLAGFVDTGVTMFKGSLGLVKSGLSLIGHPIYRLFGGKKSTHIKQKGKRAAIILVDVDSGSGIIDHVMDIFGEEIARGQLKGHVHYFCVHSSAKDTKIKKCIDEIPEQIDYIDFFGLTHRGGTSLLERYAEYAIKYRGKKPEIMLSIGCYDRDPRLAHPKESIGQQHTSWAVHYYLTSLISKRIRGIPVEQAAYQSFYEGIPLNLVNPISLGGMIAVGIIEKDMGLGYWGSKPDSDDRQKKLLNKLIDNNWKKFDVAYSSYKRKKDNAPTREELNVSLQKIYQLNQYLSMNQKFLSNKTRKNLKRSLEKYNSLISDDYWLEKKT